MRPLFWNRIQVPVVAPQEKPDTGDKSDAHSDVEHDKPAQPAKKSKSLWDDLEEIKLRDEKLDEFCQLFKRTVITAPKNFKRNMTQKTKETVSILEPKRAHTINILVTSRHLSIKDIENTVYNLDTSIIDVETLKQIHEICGTDDELQAIETFIKSNENGELGKAEQFIRELSMIDSFNERFKCIMFEVSSAEQVQAIESKLNNFRHMCEVLASSESVHRILSIILTLGNYMNGGNRDRGQADGFGLEILPKLRDVKSATSPSLTLLHYIVQTYTQTHIPSGVSSFNEVKKPLPESSELEQASTVVFDDIEHDLKQLTKQIESCQSCLDRVEGEHKEPFKSHMSRVLKKITKEHKDQTDNLQDCIQVFADTCEFFRWKAKTQQPIREFFNCWIPFCADFHSIFKNEISRKIKMELENARAKLESDKMARNKDCKILKAKPSGLKARFAKKGLINRIL